MRHFLGTLLAFLAVAATAGELQHAAARGDLERVRSLVKAAPQSINLRDRGTTALHEAVRGGHLEVVKLLVTSGAHVNTTDFSGLTPLKLALGYRRSTVAAFLRERGGVEKIVTATKASTPPLTTPGPTRPPAAVAPAKAPAVASAPTTSIPAVPPATRPARGTPATTNAPALATPSISPQDLLPVIYPIHEAARIGDLEQITYLFKTFPDLVNSTDEKANTPLHVAAANSQFRAAQVLLGLGAKVNHRNDLGQTPLHLAARAGEIGLVQLLLTNRADVNLADNLGSSPLLAAVQSGASEGLQAAILAGERYGRDVSEQRARAAQLHRRQVDLTRLLLAHGAKVNARNQSGSSALLQAVRLGNENLISLLLGAGAEPNVHDVNGQATPLHLAAGRGQLSAVKALLERQAAVNAPDARGETPLGYALRDGHETVAALLKERGANTGAAPPLSPIEQSLVQLHQKNEAALQRGSASEKARVFLAMAPSKAEVERMFPHHAAQAWKVVEQLNREIKQGFQQPVADAEQGKQIWRIRTEVPSLLTQEWRERGWFARDLPVFALVVDKTGSTSRPGDYCHVNGRWVMLPPLRPIAALIAADAASQRSARKR